MNRTLVLVWAVACSGGEATSTDAATPTPPVPDKSPLQLALEAGPPAPSPSARALSAVAAATNQALVRCPVGGSGRIRRLHGTPSDQLAEFGPTWMVEIVDPLGWDPMFDVVVSEEGWTAILAAPGSTRGWIVSGAQLLELTWPAATPGAPITCSAVQEAAPTFVRGQVTGLTPDAESYAVPCIHPPVLVGKDGTFVLETKTPCTAWIEGGGARSERFRLEPNGAKEEVSVTMAPDPLQKADRSWTPAGLVAVDAALVRVDTLFAETGALLERVGTELTADTAAVKSVERWKYEQWEWGVRIEHAKNTMKDERDPEFRKPKEKEKGKRMRSP